MRSPTYLLICNVFKNPKTGSFFLILKKVLKIKIKIKMEARGFFKF
jgi:hypothetical protein